MSLRTDIFRGMPCITITVKRISPHAMHIVYRISPTPCITYIVYLPHLVYPILYISPTPEVKKPEFIIG